jgi:hypothetical protein
VREAAPELARLAKSPDFDLAANAQMALSLLGLAAPGRS